MAETLNIRVISTGEERTIPDVEPLESAKLFWEISDEMWRRKPEQVTLACFSIGSAVPTLEARDALNEVLSDIDEELVVSGVGKAVRIGDFSSEEEAELSPELLDNPGDAHVGLYNWDERNMWRFAAIDGKKETVEFVGDHKDRHRQLYVDFAYRDRNREAARLTYSMERIQSAQDRPTSLSMGVWHSRFAESGNEGNQLKQVPLSVEQELRVLHTFQAMGGITLS